MFLNMLKAKLHKATITSRSIQYAGSISVDEDLLDAVELFPNEMVWVFNINNGERFQTYVIRGERGSREIQVNGAAARLAEQGDRVIIISSAIMSEEEAKVFMPKVIVLDDKNNIVKKMDYLPARMEQDII